ncbi:MAG: hypothetical protein A2096_14755 [Spirochaetes bacterium GWF1_41_5]|nr:MAG: hypothetical protein A2096_14755 [Spirochaetes bacterium GWF1_41_5]
MLFIPPNKVSMSIGVIYFTGIYFIRGREYWGHGTIAYLPMKFRINHVLFIENISYFQMMLIVRRLYSILAANDMGLGLDVTKAFAFRIGYVFEYDFIRGQKTMIHSVNIGMRINI